MKQIDCANCKGTGESSFTVHEGGKASSYKMKCIPCGGTGKTTKAKVLAQKKAHEAFWCACGNPSKETRFYNDGEHPACQKHHWRCADCGKVVQVG